MTAHGTMLDAPVGPHDHAEGSPSAAITLVEYADFQCGFCVEAQEMITHARRHFGRDLRLVFRHFPLRKAHPQSQLAAEMAEAVHAQAGPAGFWTIHDALFAQSPSRLGRDELLALAERFGLDAARVAHDLEAGVHSARVRDDVRSGIRSGVNGTPTFFVNGLRLDEDWDTPKTFVGAIRLVTRGT